MVYDIRCCIVLWKEVYLFLQLGRTSTNGIRTFVTYCVRVDSAKWIPQSWIHPCVNMGLYADQYLLFLRAVVSSELNQTFITELIESESQFLEHVLLKVPDTQNSMELVNHSCISFLAVQVIFICVYITNYLHFITMFLKFLTP